jgi:heme exporter protein D
MLHILLEIWIWVAAAALVGALLGWWMRSIRAAREVARETLLWQQRIGRLKRLAAGLKNTADAEGQENDSG